MATDLFYVDEHLSCRYFVSDHRCIFKYYEYEAEKELHYDDQPYNLIMFIRSSTGCEIEYDQMPMRRFITGDMVFIPKMATVNARIEKDTKVLYCIFESIESVCDKLHFHSYWPICAESGYKFDPLPIKHSLHGYMDSLIYYLKQGVSCEHFHELKRQELFLLLRWFYSKEELASLFFPIIGDSLDFRAFVLENFLKVENAAHLADLSHMGRSSFDAKFKKEFGMPAQQWILRQRAKHVKHHLADPTSTIADIMQKFNFNSPTHFTRFCKQQFGKTPTEMISILQSLSPTDSMEANL